MEVTTEYDFKAHAVAEFPREACGLVVIVKGRERYLPCRNLSEKPTDMFQLDHEDYAAAEDLGQIVALCHSHPNVSNVATQADRTACSKSELVWHIVSVSANDSASPVEAGDVNTIYPDAYVAPLVGRQFYHGVLDCYALCRDWYIQEFGITMPDFRRTDEWWKNGENLYLDNVLTADCAPIVGEPQRGDMILMQIRSKVPNHAAIYLGDGMILHHLYGRLSSRDIYGGYWLEATRLIIRHKDAPNV